MHTSKCFAIIKYEIRSASNKWLRRMYTTKDERDHDRVMRVFQERPDDYRLIAVHIAQ